MYDYVRVCYVFPSVLVRMLTIYHVLCTVIVRIQYVWLRLWYGFGTVLIRIMAAATYTDGSLQITTVFVRFHYGFYEWCTNGVRFTNFHQVSWR